MEALLQISPFYELTALLFLAALVGLAGLLLRQPMIVSFIAVGVLAGPSALGIARASDNIEVLAELGVAVLLFLVGLKLDLKLIRALGPVALATGLGQVFFTSVIGFILALVMGIDALTALYVAVALTFSSTIIIVKLLSDKKEVDSLHGRIAIGFLIVQDLVVVLAMMVLSAFGLGAEGGGEGAAGQILNVLMYGFAMLVAVGLFIRFLANRVTGSMARSPELLIIFAIGWAALLAAAGDFFGFGRELGGLLAGISLASTPYREAIVARLSPLRDFLLLFFFIALGTELDLSLLGAQLGPALVFSVFVLIGNPLIVMAIMGYMGYHRRTGFLAGLTVAQISEFSLVFMAMGLSLGHVSAQSLGLVTLVGLVTIALSVYMITWSQSLYRLLDPLLRVFQRRVPFRETMNGEDLGGRRWDVILFGLGRYGSAIGERLLNEGRRVLAVDFNPQEVRRWKRLGFEAVYGDAADHDFLGNLPLDRTSWVVSAMPPQEGGLTHDDPRLLLIDGLRRQGFRGRIAVSTQRAAEAGEFMTRGADLVLQPFQDAADRAVAMLKEERVIE